ncbi:hypothetical protein J4219_07380 [Candidatus Woesearchaeota archaeon]|nr:hypothetical protein [Candidatus Woesearchaeota archaeon]
MKLTEMIESVERIGTSGAVVQFNNGFAIAYETKRDTAVSGLADLFGWASEYGTNLNAPDKLAKFSSGFHNELQKIKTPSKEELRGLEKTIMACAKEIVAPLDVKEHTYRDFAIGESLAQMTSILAMGAVATLACPLYPIVMYYLMKESKKGQHMGSGALGLALYPLMPLMALFSPISFAYHLGKELISGSGKYYSVGSVGNRQALKKTCEDGDAAVEFYGTPESFEHMNLSFADGLSISRIGANEFVDEQRRREGEEHPQYRESKFYTSIDPAVKTALYTSLKRKRELWQEWREFDRLVESEDQKEILKQIGMED